MARRTDYFCFLDECFDDYGFDLVQLNQRNNFSHSKRRRLNDGESLNVSYDKGFDEVEAAD